MRHLNKGRGFRGHINKFLCLILSFGMVLMGLPVKYSVAQPAGVRTEGTTPTEMAIPFMCLPETGGQVTEAACLVIDAIQFGRKLSNATNEPGEVLRLLAESARKVLALTFPETLGALDARLAFVEAEFEYLQRFFKYMEDRIRREMVEDPAKAALLRQYALADSQAVETMVAQVFAEQRAVVDAAKNYLTANPGTRGIQFKCLLACQQLVAAAQGANVFDTGAGKAVAKEPPKPAGGGAGAGTVLLILGGAAAVAAGAVGIAAAAGGGLGGGGSSSGGSSSSFACSTRTCIRRVLSSGCDCSGSSNTTCTQPLPVRTSGQCISGSTRTAWCAPGFSCINGFCGTSC